MDKLIADVFLETQKHASNNKMWIGESGPLIIHAIQETILKINGFDKKIEDLAHQFYTETLLYYVHDDTHENEKKIIEMMKEIIRTGIEEYKKIF